MDNDNNSIGEFLFFQGDDGNAHIQVRLQDETV